LLIYDDLFDFQRGSLAVERMLGAEIKNTVVFALIFASRMLGLFMIYPVLALYTDTLSGATPFLIGLAMGIYGLSQALFQLPFGWLSDHFGRKPIVLTGLALFMAGSLVAAFSGSIIGVVIGRAIQGAGAIGSPILAWVADTTRESVRTRAMAIIGVTIGLTFTISLILGPWVSACGGLSSLFLLTAGLAALGIVGVMLLTTYVPPMRFIRKSEGIFRETGLWALYCNIFVLHALLSASFLILPLKIQEITGLADKVWQFYLPVLGLSLFLVMPFLRYADLPVRQYSMMQYAVIILGFSGSIFLFAEHTVTLAIGVTLFFAAFNFLEASLPARVSRIVPLEGRGMALGMYSCFQFLGLFAGGMVGGVLQSRQSFMQIVLILLVLASWVALKLSKRRNK
jgi:MFS family permease